MSPPSPTKPEPPHAPRKSNIVRAQEDTASQVQKAKRMGENTPSSKRQQIGRRAAKQNDRPENSNSSRRLESDTPKRGRNLSAIRRTSPHTKTRTPRTHAPWWQRRGPPRLATAPRMSCPQRQPSMSLVKPLGAMKSDAVVARALRGPAAKILQCPRNTRGRHRRTSAREPRA